VGAAGEEVVQLPAIDGLRVVGETAAQVGDDLQAVTARLFGGGRDGVLQPGERGGHVDRVGDLGVVQDGAADLAAVAADQVEGVVVAGDVGAGAGQPAQIDAAGVVVEVEAGAAPVDDALQGGQ
jgi:hypothetical protein